MVKIECRDALVSDADLAGFQMGLGRFKEATLTSGKATPWQSKEGRCVVLQDPVVEVDETKSDPEDVSYIQGNGVFGLRAKP